MRTPSLRTRCSIPSSQSIDATIETKPGSVVRKIVTKSTSESAMAHSGGVRLEARGRSSRGHKGRQTYSSGLRTTLRKMATRPSGCLQQEFAAPLPKNELSIRASAPIANPGSTCPRCTFYRGLYEDLVGEHGGIHFGGAGRRHLDFLECSTPIDSLVRPATSGSDKPHCLRASRSRLPMSPVMFTPPAASSRFLAGSGRRVQITSRA